MGHAQSSSLGGDRTLAVSPAADQDHQRSDVYASQALVLQNSLNKWQLHAAAHRGDLETIKNLVHLMHTICQLSPVRPDDRRLIPIYGDKIINDDPGQMFRELVNHVDKRGQTALIVACVRGHADVVTYLLNNGADCLLLDNIKKKSCLHYAAVCNHASVIRALLAPGVTVFSDGRPLVLAQLRLQDGVDGVRRYVDVRTNTGFAAIHYAAYRGHVEAVRALLQNGADFRQPTANVGTGREIPCEEGSLALHLACISGSVSVASLLLEAHALDACRRSSSPVPVHNGSLAWERDPAVDVRLRRVGLHEPRAGATPQALAAAHGHHELAALLDPSLPLLQVLPPHARGRLVACSIPSLADLAAAVLRQKLVVELTDVAAAVQPPPARASDCGAGPWSVCDSGVLITAHGDSDTESTDSDEACKICMDHAEDVFIGNCHHSLCVECAKQLMRASREQPSCPFCRQYIAQFSRRDVAEAPAKGRCSDLADLVCM